MWLMDGMPLRKQSDREFVENLYQAHKNLMFSIAKKYTDAEADDIVQSAAEKLLRQVPKLKAMEKKAVTAYVVYTVRSVGVDQCRSRARYTARFVRLEEQEDPPDPGTEAMSMDDYVIIKERMARLIAIWPRLPEEDQLLLEGRYIWELSDRELADRFHCKPDSIRMKLTRARRKALQLLEETEETTI